MIGAYLAERPALCRVAAVVAIVGTIGYALLGLASIGYVRAYWPETMPAADLILVGIAAGAAALVWNPIRRLRRGQIGSLARWIVGFTGASLAIPATLIVVPAVIFLEPYSAFGSLASLVLGGALLILAFERS